MFLDSFLVAVIGYTLAISMTKILSKKKGYTIDPTQELYAQVSHASVPRRSPHRGLLCHTAVTVQLPVLLVMVTITEMTL